MDRGDPTYGLYKTAEPWYQVTLPLAFLVIVVAIVSGLVFGGVIQGSAVRVGPNQATSTEPTVLIAP